MKQVLNLGAKKGFISSNIMIIKKDAFALFMILN
nr:MAG TPA: hypothetical protein [Caudoviricetes sp.]